MVVEYSSLIRLSGPPSRPSGMKEFGASSNDIMVHSETLLVGLFSDENVEGLGEVVVEP